jgi:hypothetical protein
MVISLDFLGTFLFITGLIIGLGSVTVIDILGFLGRKSPYWTLTTIRTHKVTKPLIWIGIFLTIVGGNILYRNIGFNSFGLYHTILGIILILNGCFLSFIISPYLLGRERNNLSEEILSQSIQFKITLSFIISFVSWWLSVVIFTLFILS